LVLIYLILLLNVIFYNNINYIYVYNLKGQYPQFLEDSVRVEVEILDCNKTDDYLNYAIDHEFLKSW